MRNRQRNQAMMLTAATVLSSALACSCSSTRAEKQQAENDKPKHDSVEVFVPTHPPVIIPHTWREEMKK